MNEKIIPIGRFQKFRVEDFDYIGSYYLADTKAGEVFAKVTVEPESFPIEEEVMYRRAD